MLISPPSIMAACACALTFAGAGLRVGTDGCEAGNAKVACSVPYAQALFARSPQLSLDQHELLAGLEPVSVPLARRTLADVAWEELLVERKQARLEREATGMLASARRFVRRTHERIVSVADPEVHARLGDWLLRTVERGVSRIVIALAFWNEEEDAAIRTAAIDFVGPPEPMGPRLAALARPRHPLPFEPLEEASLADAGSPPAIEPDSADLHTVPVYVYTTHTIRRGETFFDVLRGAGLTPNEAEEWLSAARTAYNINRVYVGQQLSLVVEGPTNEMVGMELEIDSNTKLIAGMEEGRIVVRRHSIEYERGYRAVSGTVYRSLYHAAVSKGVPDKVVSDVAEILGWDLNFARDLLPGATFKIMYEVLSPPDSEERFAGRVLAVELENNGRHHEGFFYEDAASGRQGYYDRSGKALGRYFLRYPVAFSRISSHFSSNRFHPVTKRRQPHYGVDFAARPGTPVRAVASGRVLKSGWHGGNGRFVKIRHNGVYETGYAHLSRIASSVRVGASVRKGQIIGYVGSSGLATGPHLHFALYKHGKYIDPLKADLPRADALAGGALAKHELNVRLIDAAYAMAEENPEGAVVLAALDEFPAAPETAAP